MPAIITQIINPQSYEVIRDRIGDIILSELANQYTLTSDEDINATIFLERFIPFDHGDLPAVNIMLARGEYQSGSAAQQDGSYQFNIDCYAMAKTTATDGGDTLAAFRLQRIIGICRAILMDTKYKTLGYLPGFISAVKIVDLKISDPLNQGDASSIIMGRLTLNIKVNENFKFDTPNLIEGYDTSSKIGMTGKGYVFSG